MLWWYPLTSNAQETPCAACNYTPESLDRYIQTMQDRVDNILASKQSQPNTSLWELIQSGKSLLNQWQVSLLLGEILFAGSFQGDVFMDFKTIFKGREYNRERNRLLKIDESITNNTLEMIQNNNFENPVDEKTAAELDAVLKKMNIWISLKTYGDWSYQIVSDQIKKRELHKFVWWLNMFIKAMHKHERYRKHLSDIGKLADTSEKDANTSVQKQQSIDLEAQEQVLKSLRNQRNYIVIKSMSQTNKREANKERVSLDERVFKERIIQVEKEYRCALWTANQCNQASDIRKDNWKLFSTTMKKWWESAVTTIIQATQRLAAAFGRWTDEQIESANQRKRELLHSQRWAEVDRRMETGYVNQAAKSISSLWKQLRNSEKKSQDLANTSNQKDGSIVAKTDGSKPAWWKNDPLYFETPEQIEDMMNTVFTKDSEMARNTTNNITLRSNNKVDDLELKTQLIKQSFNQVLAMQDQLQKSQIYTDPTRVTIQWPVLSKQVYEVINTIGTKNQEKSLIRHMGNVCQMQCVNLSPNCRANE